MNEALGVKNTTYQGKTSCRMNPELLAQGMPLGLVVQRITWRAWTAEGVKEALSTRGFWGGPYATERRPVQAQSARTQVKPESPELKVVTNGGYW